MECLIKTIDLSIKGSVKPVEVIINPSTNPKIAALLMHGASGNSTNPPHLTRIAEEFASSGVSCIRFNHRSSLQGRVSVAEALMAQAPDLEVPEVLDSVDHFIVAGHSMGGRVACELADTHKNTVIAAVLLSYPLHPPGKPNETRDLPLTQLTCPVMLIRGTKDPFSQHQEFDRVLKQMQSPKVVHRAIEGGDHSLKVPGGQEAYDEAIDGACVDLRQFIKDALQRLDSSSHIEPTSKRRKTS